MTLYKTFRYFLIFSLVTLQVIVGHTQGIMPYNIALTPWEAGMGNHRAVLQVDNSTDAAQLNLIWRRHDEKPEWKQFIIIACWQILAMW